MTLWRLAWVFAVLSLLGFGGGNAIIPQMHHDVVERFHWITSADFSRYYALGRLAPGPTTTMSALIGWRVAGFVGAALAALAVFVPAGVLVYALGRAWDRFHGHPWRARFARAIAPVVLGLIWAGVVTLGRGALDGPLTGAIAAVAVVLMLCTQWNQALMILGAGVLGALVLR
ncbi:MAG: chromate transporter [Candidatus Eremiobacteraeota bacterium]|nr:chromate transporter [Candidatus Eremiobacteraeota bacterium]